MGERERLRRLQRALDNPMPRELREHIGDYIESNTINMQVDHGDVMDCIDIAWPEIVDYLRAHPEALGGES